MGLGVAISPTSDASHRLWDIEFNRLFHPFGECDNPRRSRLAEGQDISVGINDHSIPLGLHSLDLHNTLAFKFALDSLY